MAQQQYEYRVIKSEAGLTTREKEELQHDLDEMAADGWRLSDSIPLSSQGSVTLIFEREVSSSKS